ncbi:MAG: thermonuclease family protein [Candidatus Absconditabacterales bacterium]|nr:thermonuclease family protein [Candidatus Absconditabacterales bacterium]
MKKILSVLLSILLLFQSFFYSTFVLGDNIESHNKPPEESSNTIDDFFENEETLENIEQDEDFLQMVGETGQSGQVLDSNLDLDDDLENLDLNGENSIDEGQDEQDWSLDKDILDENLEENTIDQESSVFDDQSGFVEDDILDEDILDEHTLDEDLDENILDEEGLDPLFAPFAIEGELDDDIIFDVSFDSGKNFIPTGWTTKGLGADYTAVAVPRLKLDDSGDRIKSPSFYLTKNAEANIRVKANGSPFSGKAILKDQDENIVFEFTDFEANKETNIIFEVPETTTQIKLEYEKTSGNLGVGSFKLEYVNENSGPDPVINSPKLKITEIYFDGEENWFEITNLADSPFSGELTLSGNLDFSFFAEIPSGVSKVFANSLYTMFQTGTNIEFIPNTISFEDEEINLDLIRSGQVLDNFFVHSSYVDYYQEYETSFEKVGQGNSWTTTVVGFSFDRYYNTNRGISANPTKYFTSGENLIDVSLDKYPYIPDPEDPEDDLNIPIDCDDFYADWILDISEVYYGTGIYPSYVELNISDNVKSYYSQIRLGGSALNQELTFNSNKLKADKRFLITDSDTWYYEGWESLYNPDFSLNSSGWLIVYGKDGSDLEVLDIVYLNGGTPGNSLYMGSNFINCAGVFDYTDKFSPGLTIGQSQFIQITPDPIIQYIKINNGGGFCPQAEGFQFNTSELVNGDIQISAVKHYGNFQILKLKNKINSDINLGDYKVQGFDGEIKSIKGRTLFAKQTMSFVGNYGFPTKTDHCLNLIKDGNIIDRYCRNSMSKATEQDEENIKNQLDFRIDNQLDGEEFEEDLEEENLTGDIVPLKNIKIKHIDYDPPGSDKDNETITLLLLTGTQIDLSQYTLQYIKDGKSTNKKLKGILTFGAEQVFKGDYTLPNSTQDKNPVIVHLLDPDKKIVDTYIYNPNKIKEIPDGEYKVVSVTDGDTIKISYLEQEFNLRFAGIDAPESSALRCGRVECFGPEAKEYLNSLLANKTISFQQEEKDDFDRFVGYIFLDGENINEKLVKNGYAREYSHKGKKYKYQSLFQSAQKYAQENGLGLRGSPCLGQRLCPVEETKVLDDYEFTIDYVLYDPEGADTGKEEITLTMHQGFPIQFSEGFYLMVNTTKKSLKNYGGISPNETKTLKGTFGFPNTKATIISLMHEDTVFATYTYDPEKDKILEKEENQMTGVDIKITAVIPNPKGKDSLGESVWFLYTLDLSLISDTKENSGKDGQIQNEIEENEKKSQNIDLSDGFYLKIGNTKKKLAGTLVPDQEALVTGNFSLPNKAACVELGYKDIIFDKFCYPHPIEGQKFSISNGILEAIIDEDFSILKTAKLQNIGNQVCLTYAGQKFYCKNMPYSKLSTKRLKQNQLYKEYFDVFENYLKNNWKVMYYNSEIKNYFDLLNKIEKAISDGRSTIELDGLIYNTNEFGAMYESQYPSTVSNSLNQKIEEFFPPPIIQKYRDLKQEYLEYLIGLSG